ncbi:Uncharacterised protein [Mycobacterium tuberculosis]|nr:Uncharacterised protein [Mycobacterium tuberculosis]
MGEMRDLTVRAERHLLRWRTRLGHETATRHLDDLAAALAPQSWAYHDAQRGRRGYLCPRGDSRMATAWAERGPRMRLGFLAGGAP